MAEPTKAPHSVQPISCPDCEARMVVQFKRGGAGLMVDKVVACVKCKKEFGMKLLGAFVGGPFPE